MWTKLGETSLAEFLEIHGKESSVPHVEGQQFLACLHQGSLSQNFVLMRRTIGTVLRAIEKPGHVILLSVYGPMENGGLPNVVTAWFGLRGHSYNRRYHWPGAVNDRGEEGFIESWFTCEASGVIVKGLLRERRKISWGSSIALGGVQVAANNVAAALKANIFVSSTFADLARLVRFVFKLNDDMNEFHIFLENGSAKELSTHILSIGNE